MGDSGDRGRHQRRIAVSPVDSEVSGGASSSSGICADQVFAFNSTRSSAGSVRGGAGPSGVGAHGRLPGENVQWHPDGAPDQQQRTPAGDSTAEHDLFGRTPGSVCGDSASGFAGGPAPIGRSVPDMPENSVRMMKDWTERNGEVLMGAGIQENPPFFDHGNASSDGWMSYAKACNGNEEHPFIPVRAMCVNIPTECFSTDATKFVDWTTPVTNAIRASCIAALTGLFATPLSKGWLSGAHEEVARAEATARTGDDQEGGGGAGGGNADAKPKGPKRVNRHLMQSKADPHQNAPMVVIGYEDVYDTAKQTVLAIRMWHFVFDRTHSTSELARRQMDENNEESANSGAAHQQNCLRKQTVVAAAKASRGLVGTSIADARLEVAAGNVYRHILNESVYMNMLPHYAGKSDKGPGRAPIDLKSLPRGALNRRISADPQYGCLHSISLEWTFNAKRPDGLAAGLVHMDGTLMDVHPDQLNVASYFDMTVPYARPNAFDSDGKHDPVTGDSHAFRVPDWIGSERSTDGGRRGFFFQTDPNQQNIFDMALPHTIVGAIKPGPTLQKIFKEVLLTGDQTLEIGSAALINKFNNEVTGRDQWEADAINALADSMVGFDTFDCSSDQRVDARLAKRNAAKGLASYGQKDGDDYVIEPRQAHKENAFTTNAVHSKIIGPWVAKHSKMITEEEQQLRMEHNFKNQHLDKSDPVFAKTVARELEFQTTYTEAMKELVTLHIAKIERTFTSKFESEAIPIGYRAMHKGLYEELRQMPDGTANMAYAQNIQLTESDRTVYGHLLNWIGTFFSDDCFVDGRSQGLMQELFFHCFEQFDEQTLLLIFCGPKGNGKTLRTERAQKAFVDGWIVMSGPSSAKSGMQGNSDSCNGCNCVYDEMIDELTAGDGDARIEYWKQILLKREFNYMKPVVVKGADGREMHRTYKLRTPHQETHVICTNRGPAFTRGDQEPSDGKQALLDRSIVLFVRTEGKKTHDDAEFEKNMADPEVRQKVRTFRILTCLTGMLKLLIYRQPFLRPDTAFAQKMWDHWDERLDRKFGLPRPSPRKNTKRLSNLTTMCCMNAVAHVFMYKQTARDYDSGKPTAQFPNGKPFKMEMLWECVQLLQPTREMIHQAWCMGLEYNIGTSAMGFCGLTIVAEAAGRKVGDWMAQLPAQDFKTFLMTQDELANHASMHEGKNPGGRWNGPPSTTGRLPELEKLFSDGTPVTEEEIRSRRDQLRKKREMREEYKYHCSRGETQNALLRDAQKMLDDAIGISDGETVVDSMEIGEESDSEAKGRDLYKKGKDVGEDEQDENVVLGWHRERAGEFPGTANCQMQHDDSDEHRRMCPYCCTDVVDEAAEERGIDNAVVATCLSEAVSCIWPDAMEACMWYKPQVLVQWAAGYAAFIEPGAGRCSVLGTRANGGLFEYKKRSNGSSGAQRLDVAWLQPTGTDWGKSWRKTADYLKNQKSHTIDMFDVHRDGLGELLWLLSTKDNARRIADEPRVLAHARPENCIMTRESTLIKEGDYVGQMAPYDDPRQGHGGRIGSVNPDDPSSSREPPEHLPRDAKALVHDSEWQRRLDTLLHAGRLAALNPLISNRVVVSPPIRMNPESGIELNVGAVHAHSLLLAESVLACATMPGLRNAQESFCNGQSGPEGLSADRRHQTGKRTLVDANSLHMLPYSYDLITIAIAEDAGLMLYDDQGPKWISAIQRQAGLQLSKMETEIMQSSEPEELVEKKLAAARTACSLPSLKFADMPHLSLRYLGYSEKDRQTLSIKLGSKRRDDQPHVEAGDPSITASNISEAHVRRSLGRVPSGHAEMAAYIGRRQGARSMGTVTGDMFASSTWFKHCILSLQSRGLISGRLTDPAARAFREMEHCIGLRVAESRCVKGVPGYADLKLAIATPGTYSAIAGDVDDENARMQKRKMYDVPNQIMGRMPFDMDDCVFDDLSAPPQAAAAGSSSDDVIAMDAEPHTE